MNHWPLMDFPTHHTTHRRGGGQPPQPPRRAAQSITRQSVRPDGCPCDRRAKHTSPVRDHGPSQVPNGAAVSSPSPHQHFLSPIAAALGPVEPFRLAPAGPNGWAVRMANSANHGLRARWGSGGTCVGTKWRCTIYRSHFGAIWWEIQGTACLSDWVLQKSR
jgi:hypothetical protein